VTVLASPLERVDEIREFVASLGLDENTSEAVVTAIRSAYHSGLRRGYEQAKESE
jgi:transcription initiation factor TFIIIB Brf1 subunit/transcription initiation factor TFIIB